MIFTSPALLLALPAMMIPVILYLLFRRKRRDVPWGAIYILRRVMETRSHTSAWLQYLIIALRVMALASLILAFAAPRGIWSPPAENAFPASPPAAHRIILLDTSASMQARTAKGTSFDAALSLCRRIINSGTAPGQIDLISLDGKSEPLSFTSLPVSAEALESALAGCRSGEDPVQWRRGLRKATELFRASPWEKRELYLLSDFLASDLREELPELCESLTALRGLNVLVHPVRFSSSEACNFALLDMAPTVNVLLANQPGLFRLRVGAYPTAAALPGGAAAAETILTITDAGGTVIKEEPFALTSGEKLHSLPITLPQGRHTLTAKLRSDALGADNEFKQSYECLPTLHAIVIQNIVTETGFDNPRSWLNEALANTAGGGGDGQEKFSTAAEAYAVHSSDATTAKERERADALRAPFSILFEGKIPEQINSALLAEAHIVILLDLDNMPEEAVQALERYVLRGGTVLLAPGPKTNAKRFNESFSALAPAALAPAPEGPIEPETYEQCLVEANEEALWRELESLEHGNLASARFYRCYPVAGETAETRTLLRLSDGAPLLQSRSLGRGSVLLWTSGLGGDWNSLVVQPGYPVLLIRLLQQAAALQTFAINLNPGEPLLVEAAAPRARILRPDGTSLLVDAKTAGDRSVLRYDNTWMPGTYDLRFDLQSEVPGLLFHVRSTLSESDLRPLETAMKDRLEDSLGTPLNDTEETLVQRLGMAYGGPAFSLQFILLALLCFLAEAGLSRKVFL